MVVDEDGNQLEEIEAAPQDVPEEAASADETIGSVKSVYKKFDFRNSSTHKIYRHDIESNWSANKLQCWRNESIPWKSRRS